MWSETLLDPACAQRATVRHRSKRVSEWVMGRRRRDGIRVKPQETAVGCFVGHVEITGYTTGAWGDRDCAICRERRDVLVGTCEVFWSPLGRQGPALLRCLLAVHEVCWPQLRKQTNEQIVRAKGSRMQFTNKLVARTNAGKKDAPTWSASSK